jgi:MFS transporter, DHA2 family, multidrug resistance protein
MTDQRAGRREWTALAVLCLPLLVASMDVSVLFFAVPFIASDLDPSATQMLWIFDIYGFVLAGLLLTMGSIGDRIGRRRLLLLGAATFSAASVVAAYSTSATMLIGARALLGVGGATLMPSTLALIRNLFPDERDRGKAIAVWSAVMSSGVGLGPVLGGLLLENFWWGSVFLINVPVMAALLVVGPFLLPEFRSAQRRPFDLPSAALSLAAVLPFIYAIKSTATDGWSPLATASGVVGVALGAVFVQRQRTIAHPMVDPALFRDRRVGGAVAVNVVGMFGVMGNAIVMTQYLQSVLGMSPLRAALWGLLPSVAVGGAAPLAASLSAKLGRARVMAGGFAVAATGFVVVATVHAGSPLAVVLVGAGVVACGTVAVLTLVTDYVLGVAPPERAGAVSGLFETPASSAGPSASPSWGVSSLPGTAPMWTRCCPAGCPVPHTTPRTTAWPAPSWRLHRRRGGLAARSWKPAARHTSPACGRPRSWPLSRCSPWPSSPATSCGAATPCRPCNRRGSLTLTWREAPQWMP